MFLDDKLVKVIMSFKLWILEICSIICGFVIMIDCVLLNVYLFCLMGTHHFENKISCLYFLNVCF